MGSLISSPEADMEGPVAKFVKDAIGSAKVVIFSKSYCPYCTMAKEQFIKLGQEFKAIEIENNRDCSEIQAVLGKMTGATSVPRVFVNGQFIGGGTDVKRMCNDGSLQQMLK